MADPMRIRAQANGGNAVVRRSAFDHVGLADWTPYVRVDPALVREGDPSEQRGDAAEARRVLGWEPSL